MRSAQRPPAGGYDEQFDALAVIAHRVAYRILGSQADAEEIAQEALARAYARWSHIEAYAEPWVAKVAANLALGHWRRDHRRGAVAVVSNGDSTDSHSAAAMRLDLVQMLLKLPRRQREVVVLRFLADRSERETAEALGCSEGTVKQHSHRALAALRISFTAADDEPSPTIASGGTDVRPA